jgi:hypothetical protein
MPLVTQPSIIVSSNQIAPGIIVNSDVASAAAIALNKLAALTPQVGVKTDASGFLVDGPPTVAQGGTGLATLTAKAILLGNGTGNILFLAPGTAGQVIKSDGTDWQAGGVPGPLLLADATGASCQNTTTETTLCTVSVPANTLSTGNAVRARCYFNQWKQNTDGDALTIRMYYGTTVVASFVFTHGAESVVEWDGYLEGILMASGATNTQEGQVEVFGHPQGGGSQTSLLRVYGEGTAAEDSTGALTFKITAQWNQAGAGSFPGIVVTRSVIEKLTV